MRIIPADPNQPIYLGPDICHCGTRMQETGCTAPPCVGLRCPDCEYGCDIDSRPDSGECAQAIDAPETLDWGQGRQLQGPVS